MSVTFQSDQPATPPRETQVATDQVAGAEYQRVKLDFGAEGASTPVTASAPLPVAPLDFGARVALGLQTGYALFSKFGRDIAVGASLGPVTGSGSYPTPTALTSIEFVSSSANDTAAGSGARAITIVGIGTNWAEVTETIATNGTTAVPLANQYYRIYR